MSKSEVSVIVTSHQRADRLRRCLLSIALQRQVTDSMEVIVADDGSTDDTPRVVEQFAGSVPFRVAFTTHEHDGFQASRCRNEGARASTAPFLLFVDGDCVLPPNHVAIHLDLRKDKTVLAGDCHRLDQETSDRITDDAIRSGEFVNWASRYSRRRMRGKAFRARIYQFFRHPHRPRLIGNNIGIWRSDYERVNGFDEQFVGWGLEDTDLQYRLARVGVRFRSTVGYSCSYHLWHDVDPSYVPRANGTENQAYLNRDGRLAKCRFGYQTRSLDDLSLRVIGSPREADAVVQRQLTRADAMPESAEVEILYSSAHEGFTGDAECNVLVLEDYRADREAIQQAHIIVGECDEPPQPGQQVFPIGSLDQALRAVA